MSHVEFNKDVADALAAQSSSVRETVKEQLVKKELQVRADAVLCVIDKISASKKLLDKIKPDQNVYDVAGVVIQAGYSKPKLDERKKLLDEVERFDKALTAAFATPHDFSKVKEIASKNNEPAKAE